MSTHTIARRYALAIFNEAVSRGQEDTVEADFSTLARIIKATPDLRRLFRSPLIESSKKKKVAIEVFQKKVSKVTMLFLELVLDKRREALMIPIIQEFEELMDHKRNILRVEVTSAKQLDVESQNGIEAALGKMTGKVIRATYKTDSSLLGGVNIRIGDMVYDGSLKLQLENLRAKLATA